MKKAVLAQTTTEPSLLIDILETARLLNVGRSTVYELVNENRLTAVKVRHRRLIVRSSVTAYLAALLKGAV